MSILCGSYEIGSLNQFRSYDDLDTYANRSGVAGLMIGEDASDYMSFYGCEIKNPFERSSFRLGIVQDNNRGEPILCPMHRSSSIAVGMNSMVQIVDPPGRRVLQTQHLDSVFHHFLCNEQVLVAITELGARILEASTLDELADIYCEVVADAVLTETELTLSSADDETICVDLVALMRKS